MIPTRRQAGLPAFGLGLGRVECNAPQFDQTQRKVITVNVKEIK
jgi:hypothetical protein